MDASGLYRCAGDIIYNDQEPVPGHISWLHTFVDPLPVVSMYLYGDTHSMKS
jgi:hypothetical protein